MWKETEKERKWKKKGMKMEQMHREKNMKKEERKGKLENK